MPYLYTGCLVYNSFKWLPSVKGYSIHPVTHTEDITRTVLSKNVNIGRCSYGNDIEFELAAVWSCDRVINTCVM